MDKNHCAARIFSFVAALLLLVVLIPATARADAYDPDKSCSITIQLQDLGTPMRGVKFRCYQVGKLAEGPQVKWELVPELSGLSLDLNKLETASDLKDAAEQLKKEVADKDLTGQEAVTDATGKAQFTNLNHGIYLVVQVSTAQYGMCEPFLASVPYTDENSMWNYDLEAMVKGQIISTPTPAPSAAPTPTPTVTPAPVLTPEPTPLSGHLPQTNDPSNPVIWVIVACVAAVCVIVLVYLKKRKK